LAQEINFAVGSASIYMDTDLLYPNTDIATDFETAFEQLFKAHFRVLHRYAYSIVKEEGTAEEMVQNVFCRLWEKREQIIFSQSAKAYLYRSVHNESLNYLKHQKVKANYQNHALRNNEQTENAATKAEHSELQWHLNKAMNELPEQCRTIFQMSRFEELKYREIADELGLSVKTIENQMGKALRILRNKLVDFLPALIISFLNL
jgi:RNA polymerase sigma-70 factor, ECF subfamily